MDKMAMQTPDGTAANIDALKKLFPEVVSEGKVDFDALKTIMGGEVAGDERYQFTWAGKRAAMVEAAKPITKTLRPCPAESKDWDKTRNIFIEGDNLDALKILQATYAGKVKMIYIDPPYNTGHDFIYHDNFHGTKQQEQIREGAVDAETGERFKVNSDSNGYFHSDWCSMMYPRLKLARQLLTEDGAIFISIDDNEVGNCRKMCDEIFGETNFVCCFKWNRTAKAPSLSDSVRVKYEYVVCYKRGMPVAFYGKQSYNTEAPLLNLSNRPSVLSFPKGCLQIPSSYKAGKYSEKYSVELLGDVFRDENTGCNIEDIKIQARFKWVQSRVDDYLRNGFKFIIKKDPATIYYQMDPLDSFIPPADVINDEECGVKRNTEAQEYMREIGVAFDFSKPVSLLRYLIKMHTYNDASAVVLDFFSGSATTADAVMQLNVEDSGIRKYIMVQLPEACADDSESAKDGYKNICEVAKERIRRAGEKIKDENATVNPNLDIGFRVFKVDSSNMTDIYYAPKDVQQYRLHDMVNNIKPDRKPIDLLYGCLLDWGLPIDLPHEEKSINGHAVFSVGGGLLMACFDQNVDDTTVKAIAAEQPAHVIFRDTSFSTSAVKINVGEIFKALSPDTKIRVL